MSFVFPFVLGGLAFVSIPILLHLIMRQKPKHLLFPAFRFLLQRHRTNLRKLRLRHLLLLCLRVLLLAAVCLALARPKVFSDRLHIGREAPVAAVLLIDTSPTMDYAVADKSNHKTNRLDDAKRRARELLDELPADSKVVILDTTRGNPNWLSPREARKHIDDLQIRWDSVSVMERLHNGYGMLEKLALERKEETLKNLPRFLYVFSDRTQGCWDTTLLKARQEDADRIAPPIDRLQKMGGHIGPLIETLQSLKKRLPIKGEQKGVLEALRQLGEFIPGANTVDYPDATGLRLLAQVRKQLREQIQQIQLLRESLTGESKEQREKVLEQLQDFLRDLKGAHEIFVDVGVDKPMDLAIADLILPGQIDRVARQVFFANETWDLRATVRATGTDFDSHIDCFVDGKKNAYQPLKVKAGGSKEITFEIDCAKLPKGFHHIELRLPEQDTLPFNNTRFATFEIRAARQVLTIVDRLEDIYLWRKAVNASREFKCEPLSTQDFIKLGIDKVRKYKAICLFEVGEPNEELWKLLDEYVSGGSGLIVMPPANDREPEKSLQPYDDRIAKRLLPGRFVRLVKTPPKQGGVLWNWQSAHFEGLLRPFRQWITDPGLDFMKVPRRAYRYWEVEPNKKDGEVLVRYAGKAGHPALLEKSFNKGGKVLLFTTPLNGQSDWNNYMEKITSFSVILPYLSLRYLGGSFDSLTLNFLSGQPVVVPLPLEPRHPPYHTDGRYPLIDADPSLEPSPKENFLHVKGAIHPGNYSILDRDSNRVGGFSVNVAPAESNMTRVPAEQIAALFGPNAVVPVSRDVKLLDALRNQWSQPVELLPFLLVLVLFVLAVECLLANKFYRRDPDGPQEPVRAEGEPS